MRIRFSDLQKNVPSLVERQGLFCVVEVAEAEYILQESQHIEAGIN